MAGSLYAWAIFAATFGHDGVIGPHYNAPGSDWIVFHGAVQAFRDGNLALIADGERFTAFLNERYGWWLSSSLPFHPWLYPPTFLLVLLPFCWLPFLTSYAVFQIASFTALVAASWGLTARKTLIPVLLLLSPAAAITVIAGQNAFLTAALVLGGLRLLPRAPVWAGILFGMLTIKPQFGLLIAVALVPGSTGVPSSRPLRRPEHSRSHPHWFSAGKPGLHGLDFFCRPISTFIRSGWSGAGCGVSASTRARGSRASRIRWRICCN
jgi:hypothetical protein